jgi:photosystem II stability/assembly factor-like uncharacterized protein
MDSSVVVSMDNYSSNDFSGISTDDGATWNEFAADTPVLQTGGTGAASTASNIILIGGNNGAGYYTTDGGDSWTGLTLPGTTNDNYIFAFYLNRHIVAADSVTANKFYLYKSDVGLFSSTNSGVTWTDVHGPTIAAFDGANATLKAVPGQAGHLFFTAGQIGGANPADTDLMQSTDSGDTWSAIANVDEAYSVGFGSVQSGGYPSIFIAGWVSSEWGIWRSDDEGTSWTKIGEYPLGSFDWITTIDGAKDGSNRVYVGFRGSGAVYGEPASSGGGGLTGGSISGGSLQ